MTDEQIAAKLDADIRAEIKRGWLYYTFDMVFRAEAAGVINEERRLTPLGIRVRKILEAQG